MASLNKVLLIGNLGKDPELKYTPGGQAVATFTLATNRKWKDKDGNPQEDTQWHNIKVWARNAEIAQQYLKKGRSVYVEGRLEHRQYDDKDGNRKYFTEVVADRFLMLGSKGGDEAGPAPEDEFPNQSPARKEMAASTGKPMEADEDLPF